MMHDSWLHTLRLVTQFDSTRLDPTRLDPTRFDSTRLDSTRLDSTRNQSPMAVVMSHESWAQLFFQ